MSTISWLKLAITLLALIFFIVGVRTGEEWLRWLSIGLLVAAVILRFVDRGRREKRES